MTRILSSIFYISSMRKASEEFNSDTVISNIGYICKEELPYWETINDYLKRLSSDELQEIICQLVRRLIRSRAFQRARIRGKYWRVIVDGTQLVSSRKKLDGACLYRIHKKGTKEEYRKYYDYVLEARLYLHKDIYVSIMTEFVESQEKELEKQDCQLKACYRLMERLKEEFPMLRICISGDSLYTCQRIFEECGKKNWKYLIRLKKGRIPAIYESHYLLIQIGHMISQVMEGVEKLWKEVRRSREQKHKRLPESWKGIRVEEYIGLEERERSQYRFV